MKRSNPGDLPNALSFDVEDYFQVSAFEGSVPREDWDRLESRVERNTERILDLLRRHRARATFFVLGWVAERHPAVVRAIAAEGHEVASHGHSHRLVYRMTPEEFRADAARAKGALEDLTGRPVLGYRAPSFSIVRRSLWALGILEELGHRYDSSIFPIRHDRYGIAGHPRFPHRLSVGEPGEGRELVEFPMSTARLGPFNLPVAGGGYLRLLPYRFIRWGLRRIEREGKPFVFYLHPWELDPGQPRLPCGRLTRLRHYRGLDRAAERLEGIVRDFRCAPLSEVLESLGLLKTAEAPG